ncbi:8183_t:CDS:2, partial [Diversispora eburnea]
QLSLSKVRLTKIFNDLEDESENYKPIPPIPIAQTQSKELPQALQEIRNNQEAWNNQEIRNNQEYENNQENQYIQVPVETKVNYFIGDNSDSTNKANSGFSVNNVNKSNDSSWSYSTQNLYQNPPSNPQVNLQQNNLPPPLSQDLSSIEFKEFSLILLNYDTQSISSNSINNSSTTSLFTLQDQQSTINISSVSLVSKNINNGDSFSDENKSMNDETSDIVITAII